MSSEGLECLGVEVAFPADSGPDPILKRFGDPAMIANMEKVFFGQGTNPLGHSYAGLMRGPAGRNDFQDVIDLLRQEPWSKRAVITLCGNGEGKVPCINLVQFLIRNGSVQTIYFARGQDAFQKFYADALCISLMARKVADALSIPAAMVTGFIGSCHIYQRDVAAIERLLSTIKSVEMSPTLSTAARDLDLSAEPRPEDDPAGRLASEPHSNGARRV